MSLNQREIKLKLRINYYYSLGTLRNIQIMAASETTDLHVLPGILPNGQVSFKSHLPIKKIYLPQMT